MKGFALFVEERRWWIGPKMESRPHYDSSQSLLDWPAGSFGDLYQYSLPVSGENYQYDEPPPSASTFAQSVSTVPPIASFEYRKVPAYRHGRARDCQMTGKRSKKTPSSCGDAGPSEPKYSRLTSTTSSVASVASEDFGGYDSDDDDNRLDDSGSPTLGDDRKKGNRQNHSEIEKRRRDKMNLYITELSQVVPLCVTMSHKLDKLTVLRMAVQHLKTIRGSIHSYTEGDYKPSFLSDDELKKLILQSADGFLFVVDCDRGRILYMSESVSQVLNYSQADLLGQSWFDILHPKDVAKVKEQLSSSDLSPRERLIDSKTMLPVKTEIQQNSLHRLCPGARRSFFCRMRCKVSTLVKEEADSSTGCSSTSRQRKAYNLNREKKYSVIHCTGYLKAWTPSKLSAHGNYQDEGTDSDPCNLSCLVAVGRIQPSVLSPQGLRGRIISRSGKSPEDMQLEYISRHANDGKFTFVEQKATLIQGYLPQEMLGTSVYEYLHADDIPGLAASHKAALLKNEEVITPIFRFRTREGTFIRLQSRLRSFRNPWTKEIECILARNAFMISEGLVESTNVSNESISIELHSPSRSGRQYELEAGKIGQAIADEVLDSLRRSSSGGSGSVGPSPSSLLSGGVSPFSANGSPGLPLVDIGMPSQGDGPNVHPPPSHSNGGRNSHRGPGLDLGNRQIAHMLTEAGLQADDDMMEVIGGLVNDATGTSGDNDSTNPNFNGDGIDGNDEAAMAVVMSLLEADAGLGGPVDFSGLPWPLP